MVVVRDTQRLDGEVLQRQQSFGTIFLEQLQVAPRKPDDDVRVLDLGMRIAPDGQFYFQIPARNFEELLQKRFNLGPVLA